MSRDLALESRMVDELICNVSVDDLTQEFKRVMSDPVYMDYFPEFMRSHYSELLETARDSQTALVLVDVAVFAAMCVLRRKNGLPEPIGAADSELKGN